MTLTYKIYHFSGKGKGKKSSKEEDNSSNEKSSKEDGALPKIDQPLRALDIFAGAGGLSLGLHQSGIGKPTFSFKISPLEGDHLKVS